MSIDLIYYLTPECSGLQIIGYRLSRMRRIRIIIGAVLVMVCDTKGTLPRMLTTMLSLLKVC